MKYGERMEKTIEHSDLRQEWATVPRKETYSSQCGGKLKIPHSLPDPVCVTDVSLDHLTSLSSDICFGVGWLSFHVQVEIFLGPVCRVILDCILHIASRVGQAVKG